MTTSPLRWAGSKRSLIKTILAALPIEFDRYIEPFMGSACVFFEITPTRAILSDFNAELVQFFVALRDEPHALHRRLAAWGASGEDYYAVRSIESHSLDPISAASRFLYLNRFAYNGVYRTNRSGQFNVPRGSRTGTVPSQAEITSVSERLQGHSILHADYLSTTSNAGRGDFVYLDPPYRNANRATFGEYGYGAFGTVEDVERLGAELRRLNDVGAHVMLSFNDDHGLEKALQDWEVTEVSRRRQVAPRPEDRTALRGEILATNYTRRSDVA